MKPEENYDDMENDETIAFKLPAALKEDFQRWCNDNAINMSEWFRQRVKKTVESSKQQKNKKEQGQT